MVGKKINAILEQKAPDAVNSAAEYTYIITNPRSVADEMIRFSKENGIKIEAPDDYIRYCHTAIVDAVCNLIKPQSHVKHPKNEENFIWDSHNSYTYEGYFEGGPKNEKQLKKELLSNLRPAVVTLVKNDKVLEGREKLCDHLIENVYKKAIELYKDLYVGARKGMSINDIVNSVGGG